MKSLKYLVLVIFLGLFLFMNQEPQKAKLVVETPTAYLYPPKVEKTLDKEREEKILSISQEPIFEENPTEGPVFNDDGYDPVFVENERLYAEKALEETSYVLCDFQDLKLELIAPSNQEEFSNLFKERSVCQNANDLPVDEIPLCLTTAILCQAPMRPTDEDLALYLTKDQYLWYLKNEDELIAYVQNPLEPKNADDSHWHEVQERLDYLYARIHGK